MNLLYEGSSTLQNQPILKTKQMACSPQKVIMPRTDNNYHHGHVNDDDHDNYKHNHNVDNSDNTSDNHVATAMETASSARAAT